MRTTALHRSAGRLAAVLALAATGVAQKSPVFSDTTFSFDPAASPYWSHTFCQTGFANNATSGQRPFGAGGPLYLWLRHEHNGPVSTVESELQVRPWNVPLSGRGVHQIRFQCDLAQIQPLVGPGGASLTVMPAVFQGGMTYVGPGVSTATLPINPTVWPTYCGLVAPCELIPARLKRYNRCAGGVAPGNPDFSANGGTLTFGFVVSSTSSGFTGGELGIDNVQITVFSKPAVFGVGCGPNGPLTITESGVPRLGGRADLVVGNLGGMTAGVFVLGLPTMTPQPIPFAPFCNVGLLPTPQAHVPFSTATGRVSFPLPPLAAPWCPSGQAFALPGSISQLAASPRYDYAWR